jgi:hypothetical protein
MNFEFSITRALVLPDEEVELIRTPEVGSEFLRVFHKCGVQVGQCRVVQGREEMVQRMVAEERHDAEVTAVYVFAVHHRFHFVDAPVWCFSIVAGIVNANKHKRIGEYLNQNTFALSPIFLKNMVNKKVKFFSFSLSYFNLLCTI